MISGRGNSQPQQETFQLAHKQSIPERRMARKPGTTMLKMIEAGVLKINNNQYHKILDPETGKRYASYSGSTKQLPLPPGRLRNS